MDILQKLKLRRTMKKAGNAFADAAKSLDECVTEVLKAATENVKAENELAAVSSYDLVHALRPVVKELCEWTGKRYDEYLELAKEMILAGKDQADVLWHFSSMLRDLE